MLSGARLSQGQPGRRLTGQSRTGLAELACTAGDRERQLPQGKEPSEITYLYLDPYVHAPVYLYLMEVERGGGKKG